jgi:hypothetical protein
VAPTLGTAQNGLPPGYDGFLPEAVISKTSLYSLDEPPVYAVQPKV